MKVMLDYDATLPTRAHETDAGWDLYSNETTTVPACTCIKTIDSKTGYMNQICYVGSKVIDTGVHIQLPKDTCGLLVSKSGLNVNHGITSTGLIDEGYTGSIKVKLYNNTCTPYEINKGDKISQLVVLPVIKDNLEIAYTLDETDRGEKGFGSSGK